MEEAIFYKEKLEVDYKLLGLILNFGRAMKIGRRESAYFAPNLTIDLTYLRLMVSSNII